MRFPRTNLEVARAFRHPFIRHLSEHERVRLMYKAAVAPCQFITLHVAHLSGVLPCTLRHFDPPLPETDEIVDDLIALNRAGFITDFSQTAGFKRKPAVHGVIETKTAIRIGEALNKPEEGLYLCHISPISDGRFIDYKNDFFETYSHMTVEAREYGDVPFPAQSILSALKNLKSDDKPCLYGKIDYNILKFRI